MKKILFGLTAALLTSAAAANTLIPDVSPASSGQHVVINITQQRLFLYDNGKLSKIYPVAVGKAMTQTNLGEHKIGAKATTRSGTSLNPSKKNAMTELKAYRPARITRWARYLSVLATLN